MKHKIVLYFSLTLIVCFCCASSLNAQETQTSLTNQDVLTMVKTGLSPEIITAKIKSSNNKFDTAPNTLKELKESGVPDSIILVMVQTPSVNNQMNATPGKADAVSTEAKSSEVKVYVYRRKEFNTRNMQPSVYVDGTEVARMDDGKFFIVMLTPGKHKVFVNKEHSGADIEMKAGEEYYFRVSMKPGFLKARGEVEYVQKEQGVFEMNKMNPLESKWIKDKSVTVEK